MEGHSSRLGQAEDIISELEDEMEIKGKTEDLLLKQLKTCERNMQELTNSIKRLNLRIMSIEEREEVQGKGICNIFNKIITENFSNLEKTMPIQVQEVSRTPNRFEQNRTTPQHIIKTTSTENSKRILKAVRKKKQITYKGKPIKITADFSTETLKVRREWREVFWALNENNFNPRILYPAKISFKIDGAI
jgi:chromosome segregation ATPase